MKYVFTNGEDCDIDFNNGYVKFDKVYDESGVKIYKITYLL